MIRPGTLDLRLLRHQADPIAIQLKGFNFAASAFQLQVRPTVESATLDLDLANAAAPGNGISAVSSPYPDGTPGTLITIRVNQASREGFPQPLPAGTVDLVRAYDLKIDGVVWFRGAFIIEGTVTV